MRDYEIALTNVIFDYNYNNVLRFDSREAQKEYFKLNTLFANSVKCNFNTTTLLNTRIFYKYNETTDLEDLMFNNYAIVKDIKNDKYYFYFIIDCKQDSGNQLLLDLKLDVMQTFLIDLKFTDGKIIRAHLNRFEKDGSNYKFKNNKYSDLFENESNDFAKRLIKRTKINVKIDSTENSILNEFLKNNVEAWQYIYLSPGTYDIYSSGGSSNSIPGIYYGENDPYLTYNAKYDSIDGEICVMCYPIMKKNSNKKIRINRGDNITPITPEWSTFGILTFKSANNNTSNFYANKISIMPPFNYGEYVLNTDYYIDTNGDLVFNAYYPNNRFFNCKFYFSKPINGDIDIFHQSYCVILSKNFESHLCDNYSINDDISFSYNELKGLKNKKFNPKLLSSNYKGLNLVCGSNTFEYDIQKLNLKNLEFEYFESLSPDITRGYFRIKNVNDIYIPDTSKNFTGLVFSSDNSVPMVNDQLANMLANNKNYYLQAGLSMGVAGIKNITSKSIHGDSMGSADGPLGSVLGGFVGGAIGSIETGLNYYNFKLTNDNMKNAPDLLKNANGNSIFNYSITNIGLYVEEYSAIENELEIENDEMILYGFNYNKIGNINDFINIRKYYNFIQAIDFEIIKDNKISKNVEEEIKRIFNKGARFWNLINNNTTFNYNNENYERWIDE